MKLPIFIAFICVSLSLILAQLTINSMRSSINLQGKLIDLQKRELELQRGITCVTNRQWKVTEGDFNVLIDKLQSRGFSNTVISMEKNGHLFDVDIPNRTNATIRYIGKKL